jgi:cytochrome P450
MHPEKQKKLQEEVDKEFPSIDDEITCSNTRSLAYVNGVVNEALRLWPAVPSGAQAQTPPQGYTIAGTYVPGNVDVRIAHLAIMSGKATHFF